MMLQLSEKKIKTFIKKVNWKKFGQLVPVVVQDATDKKVLMQAFMNEEALRLTLTTGKLHFWSRERKKLWFKGETSGNYSLVQNVSLDCDNDAILFIVQQIGNICHTNQETCFHKPLLTEHGSRVDAQIIERIFEVISDRIKNPIKDSYVSNLIAKGDDAILQKIGEEAVELILASKTDHPKEIVHEATDVLFHVLVLLAQKNLNSSEIFKELVERHQERTRYKTRAIVDCNASRSVVV